MNLKIRKAVFPVAGLGTRVLPATKALPKEMLTLVDRPLIQYAIEEAASAGVTEFIFVTAQNEQLLRDYFRPNPELERELAQRGQQERLKQVQNILPRGTSCRYVTQHEPLGLGHAVRCAASWVGDEPFAVLLPDDLIHQADKSCLQQMMEVYQQQQASVVAVENVPPEQVSRYGVVTPGRSPDTAGKMQSIVEKPATDEAPSTLAVVGRYIFTPTLMPLLAVSPKGAGNEIQLTDAIATLLEKEDVYLYELEGQRHDCGSALGLMQANIDYALRDATIGAALRAYISGLVR